MSWASPGTLGGRSYGLEACLSLGLGRFRGNARDLGACLGPGSGPCWGDVRACPDLTHGTVACHVLRLGAVPRDVEACLGLALRPFRGNVGDTGVCLGPGPGSCRGDVWACPYFAHGIVACHVLGRGAVPRNMRASLGFAPRPFGAMWGTWGQALSLDRGLIRAMFRHTSAWLPAQ